MANLLQQGKTVKLPKGRVDQLREIIRTYTTINAELPKLTLDEVKKCLYLEVTGENRKTVVDRIHGRLTNLRRKAEREELEAAA